MERIIQMGSSNLTLTSTARASRTISESFDARFAASSRSDEARIFRPESCISLFASSIFVPAAATSTIDQFTEVLTNRCMQSSLEYWGHRFTFSEYKFTMHIRVNYKRDSSIPWKLLCQRGLSWEVAHLSSLHGIHSSRIEHKTNMFAIQGSLVKLMAKTLDTRTERATSFLRLFIDWYLITPQIYSITSIAITIFPCWALRV